MIDNQELNEILSILENMSDEERAVSLLREFNSLTSRHGKLILNLDKSLSHEEWKKECDHLENKILTLVKQIKNQ